MLISPPACGLFSVGRSAQSANTVVTAIIPPYPATTTGSGPLLYNVVNTKTQPNWVTAGALTHITTLLYTTTSTTHRNVIMRPFNWTYFAAAVAKNTTVVTIFDDPGVYSTNYKYSTPGGAPPTQVADNAIAANDYVAYQLADGTWMTDIVSSVSGLAVTLTTGTPNRTGATIAIGAPMYFFGIYTDADPATGGVSWQTDSTANTNRINQIQDSTGCGVASLHPGDPLIFYGPNGSNAGVLDSIFGYYAKC